MCNISLLQNIYFSIIFIFPCLDLASGGHLYDTLAPTFLAELPCTVLPSEFAHMTAFQWNSLLKNIDFSKKCPWRQDGEGSEDQLLPIDAT